MTEEEGARQSPDANSDKKAFGKDVGKLVSGTVVAQVVGIILIPIITRIFGPEIFGSAAVLLAIISVLTVISCLLYERAIVLPKEEEDACAIFLACLLILFCISIIITIVFLLFGESILVLLNASELAPYMMIVPLLIFIDGLYLSFRYWNTRKKRFGTQAVTQALQSITGSSTKLGFGMLGFVNPGSLIIGQMIGQIIGTLILGVQIFRSDIIEIKNSFYLPNIKRQIKRYKKFPLIYTWSELLNALSGTLPVFLLSSFFTSTIVGFYTLGYQILHLPLGFIGSSIGQVFFQRAAVAKHEGNLHLLVEDIVSMLITISVVPFSVLTVAGGVLFSVVFGAEWYQAGVFAQILALWMLIVFITNPISTLVSVLEIQEFGLKMNVIIFILRLVTLSIGGVTGNIYLGLVLFMLSGVFFNGYYNYYVVKKSGGSFWKIFGNVKVHLGIAGIVLCALLILNICIQSSMVIFAVSCGIVIVYEVFVFKNNTTIRQYIFK